VVYWLSWCRYVFIDKFTMYSWRIEVLMKMSPTVICSVILLNPFGGDGFPIPTRQQS
jgi:hypothetical protein